MSERQALEATVSEPLTWAEIRERHPDEWVCLVEIDRIEENNFEFRTARVVGHGKTRREPLDQARPLRIRYEEIGHYYTGRFVAPLPRFL
jgi:DNA primase